MGLDISAYRKLELVPHDEVERDEDGDLADWEQNIQFYSNSDFPHHFEGLDKGAVYTRGEESYGFRAGSYSGYGQWRATLASMVGFSDGRDVPDDAQGPFVELINFSDCEGTIGPVVSRKLHEDFVLYKDKATEFASTLPSDEGEWFLSKYQDWERAFALAKDDGAVCFH